MAMKFMNCCNVYIQTCTCIFHTFIIKFAIHTHKTTQNNNFTFAYFVQQVTEWHVYLGALSIWRHNFSSWYKLLTSQKHNKNYFPFATDLTLTYKVISYWQYQFVFQWDNHVFPYESQQISPILFTFRFPSKHTKLGFFMLTQNAWTIVVVLFSN
jgi:hypothetical protein